MKFEIIENIINGNFDTIPELKKKVVRIFISSTFTDTQNERDYLIENIFPKLKEYCKKQYDLDFQTVDMRWGVPSDSYEKHGVTELCLKEVINCRNESIGPNFVALLSHKYGKRLLSHKIKDSEFEIIKNEIIEQKLDLSLHYNNPDAKIEYHINNLFNTCFKLDTNEKPNFYNLLPISQIVNDYISPDPLLRENGNKFWNLIETKIGDYFRLGAKSAFEKNLINKQAYERYYVSTTEKEIYNGIIKVKDPNRSALCFIREIENIQNSLDDKRIERFIDIKTDKNGAKVLDTEAQELLKNLKEVKIPEKLDQNKNIFYYKVSWKDNAIDPVSLEPYLKSFGETFYREIKRLIDDAIQTDYIYNKLNYEAFVNKSHGERAIDKLRRVKEKMKMNLKLNKEVETKVIQRDLILKELSDELKVLIHEIASHSRQYTEITSKFFGRDDLILKIKNYILNESKFPFIVTGESGCGKTNVMAICANKVFKWVENPDDYTVILRFLGTSIDTSSIFKTYSSVAIQLHFIITMIQEKKFPKKSFSKQNLSNYDLYRKANDVNSLVNLLFEQFKQIYDLDPNRRILLILDSLDQLTPNDYKNVSHWFFTQLPENVKVLLSTLPKHGNLLSALQKRIDRTYELLVKNESDENIEKFKAIRENQILAIETLSIDLSETILRNWLLARNKFLSDEQWDCLRDMFRRAHLLPLYLQLIYDIVQHWRSYETADEMFKNCLKIDDFIKYLFLRLETLHGKVIFSHAVFYMTACKNGISENELEDILSLDDEVLMSIFQYHIPPIRRIPFILWVRIRNDLSDYIVEREANDTKVIYWYHRRFIEIAIEMYVNKLDTNGTIFQNMIDFYNETWRSVQKPFKINPYLKKKLGINDDNTQADRYISSQPIEYVDNEGKINYNKRKLTELPNCLANINSSLGLEKACQLIFYNYTFLHAKFSCDTLADIKYDLRRIIDSTTSYGVTEKLTDHLSALKILYKLFFLCGDLIEDFPDTLAYQITSRLLVIYGESEIISNFIDECDELSVRHCAFVSPHYQLPTAGGALISTFNTHYAPITHMITLPILMQFLYVITLSKNKIDIYTRDETKRALKSVLEIALPSMNQLLGINYVDDVDEEPDMDDEYTAIKTVVFTNLDKVFEDLDLSSETPENFPINFLLISKHLVYIIASNKEIKFKYLANAQLNHEILDAIVIARKQIVIIEKHSNSIKLFSNVITNPKSFVEYKISDRPIIQLCLRHTVKLDSALKVAFLVILSDYSTKKIVITNTEINNRDYEDEVHLDEYESVYEKSKDYFDSDNDEDDYETDEVADDYEGKTVIEKFKIERMENVLPSLKICNSIVQKSQRGVNFLNVHGTDEDLNLNTYLSFKDGTFVIAKENPREKLTKLIVFKSVLKEPIKQFDNFNRFFVIRTENYMYIVHRNDKHIDKDDADEEDGDDEKKSHEYCFVELHGKFDCVTRWHDDSILASRNGLIEVYKIQCLQNKHRMTIRLSISAHTDVLTDLVNLDGILLSTSRDGLFKYWNALSDTLKNDFTNFERTSQAIIKFVVAQDHAATISNDDEITIWKINTGKIICKIDLKLKVKQVKFSQNEAFLLILFQNNDLIAYYNFQHKLKFNVSTDKLDKLHLIDNLLINSKLNTTNELFYAIDLTNLKLFELSFSFTDTSERLEPPLIKEYQIKESADKHSFLDNVIVITSSLEIFMISKNFESFKKFNLNERKSDTTDNQIQETKSQSIDFENKDDYKQLKEYFKENSGKTFRYNLLSSFNDSMFILINILSESKKSMKSGVVMKVELSREKKNLRVIIEEIYFDCKNVFTQPDVLCIHTIQTLNESKGNKVVENQILVKNYKTLHKYELRIEQNIKINHICVDSNAEYLAYNDNLKVVSLYRINDGKKLAAVPLYDFGIHMRFSLDSQFLCLTMQDRRIFCLLLVDPENPKHLNRIKELPSRQKTESEGTKYDKNNLDEESESDEDDDDSAEEDIIDIFRGLMKVRRKKSLDKREIHEKMVYESSDSDKYYTDDSDDDDAYDAYEMEYLARTALENELSGVVKDQGEKTKQSVTGEFQNDMNKIYDFENVKFYPKKCVKPIIEKYYHNQPSDENYLEVLINKLITKKRIEPQQSLSQQHHTSPMLISQLTGTVSSVLNKQNDNNGSYACSVS